jgi:DNA-directed RNA polymerase specialized sigma24 family protein
MDHGQGQSYAALDDAFIVRLYQQHALSLMTYVRRHVSSREDAEDIVLEVFLAALKRERSNWPGCSAWPITNLSIIIVVR